ncbi:hypothetical protein [Streptomyces sp. Amel2xC10]|uniref:hypothetical protein n=1 Tax=Streptomyces sp. Amel2xC10 TaxID=1305826 RepID=UPI000A08C1FD|nr:hypothetical protein [Streptomyces sp. Amel2xC10]SMF64614.1 hypothetical protein SAMN02745830_05025 [Streptomyces sp. Amel2xC10]
MEGFFAGLEQAIRERNWHATLVLALTLPDICAKTVTPVGGSRKRYADWFDRHVSPKYMGGSAQYRQVHLSGNDCYALRCALLHEGTTDTSEHSAAEILERFQFVTPGERGNIWHNNRHDATLILMVDQFAKDVLDSARAWWASVPDEQRHSRQHLALIDADTLEGI